MLSQTLAYAASLVPAIADEIAAVDEAMRCGYNWERGPFELLDQIGPAWFVARLAAEGRPVPPLLRAVGDGTFYRVEGGRLEQLAVGGGYARSAAPEGVLLLADLRRAGKPVAKSSSASVWDLGDGVLCLEFTTKMNALDDGILRQLRKASSMIDGKALQGPGDLQRGEQLLGRRQHRHRPLRRQHRALAGDRERRSPKASRCSRR